MEITRRQLLQAAAGTAVAAMTVPALGAEKAKGKKKARPSIDAATRARALGANDRIRIGQIGCGNRGYGTHMPSIYAHLAAVPHEVVAIADPWRLAREKGAARAKEYYGSDPKLFSSYRELLEMKDIDAVMIASPDHLHTRHLEAAALAGKHIYVEKPMGIKMDKLLRAFDTAKASGKVIQVGTQLRSMPASVGSRDLVKTGILGKISRVEECRNSEKPYWYGHLDNVPLLKEADVDWKEFLDDLPDRPFDPRAYAVWYGYYEFSQGPVPQWGSHFIDLMHFITGCGFPESCVCMGGTFIWKDENKFTAPDHVQALWTYPEGFMVSYSTNFGNGFGNSRKIFGDKGVLKFENWAAPVYTAEGGPRRDGSIRGENPVKPVEETPDHFLNWLQCVKNGGGQLMATLEAGLQHSVATIMAQQSFETGRRTKYDAERRMIIEG